MSTAIQVKALFNKCTLPISVKFQSALIKLINAHSDGNHSSITLNFRDTGYSAEAGGFHPVEVALLKDASERWSIQYITDFAYTDSACQELERSVDFDMGNSMAFFTGVGWQPIDAYGVSDFYELWENNFLSYLAMGAFDQIKASSNL
ncbi:DUF2787 family protein [Vibrio parahaemolyticus]|uniref:DUF2787 family protein n=1 Tax=Vibrio parahaemolyticus TaxID=670 RepID=UPI001FAE4490|nr:DUF2787 family protein [Vibrio parahaemolyticus]MCI9689789.1 DUF2787 domain-containing protein [Vibrio parahaemolyticus]